MSEPANGEKNKVPLHFVVPTDGNRTRAITPTDLAQFIRLDQCQRYLRLRLHERGAGPRFMRDFGVVTQSIPPLLTRSGEDFEQGVEQDIQRNLPSIHFKSQAEHNRPDDNAAVIEQAAGLNAGQIVVLFQPRLRVTLGNWRMRGDVDLLRLERDDDGRLHLLVADLKSSTSGKLEHRLQVACYVEMLAALLDAAGIPYAGINMGVLYRGSAHGAQGLSAEQIAERDEQRAAVERLFRTSIGFLDLVAEPRNFLDAVRDLVTGPGSTAEQVVETAFEQIPYHLTYTCDGCLYNEFCMKWSAEQDDLSLLPHLTALDKNALKRNGINQVTTLARLKELPAEESEQLTPAPGQEQLVQQLTTVWPVGPRLDELIHRAKRYRKWKHDDLRALSYIPNKGYGSLPYRDANQNPNLVMVYIDAQHDYLNDRIYLIGALVVAHQAGQPVRRRHVVHLTEGPPESAPDEAALLGRWIEETITAIIELAAPDEDGQKRAPIHIVFFNRFEQRLLLDALARHFEHILGTTPLYDFVTQLAAFDSPLVSFLDQEMREQKNYPIVCQSLQATAAFLKFDWNSPEPYRSIFRARLFDFWSKFDSEPRGRAGESPWYFGRARFNSQLPLEYAYAAWGELPDAPTNERDDFLPYRQATADLLRGFHARRLDAIEHIAHEFKGNQQTQKTAFDLPELGAFTEKAATLAQALEEFVTIERHVELGAWKSARLVEPERRVLTGETLIVRYNAADQAPEIAARNRDLERRRLLQERYREAYRVANPDAKRVHLSKEQKAESDWTLEGLKVRLRLDASELDCDLSEALSLLTLRPGQTLVLCPRFDVDSRLPDERQVPFTPTPKQMLYAVRARLERIVVERDDDGRAVTGFVEVELQGSRGGPWSRGFAFPASLGRPLRDGVVYTLDPDPNNWPGYWSAKVTEGLVAGERNTLYERLVHPALPLIWGPVATEGQQQFMAGLDALHAAGVMHGFEPSKRAFIGDHGAAPVLLVQGPPGTGKSYSTAFALLARMQGALAEGRTFRVLLSCKTHAATDVLLQNIREVQQQLRSHWMRHPEHLLGKFDPRLLDVPLYRIKPRQATTGGVIPLQEKNHGGEHRIWDVIEAAPWCFAAATPGAVYKMTTERWQAKNMFGHDLFDCLVLDEASQMNLPEAAMAALPLKPDGRLIVVGDHRQMPPIVQHSWETEPRRTFQEFRSYESLFLALLERDPPLIQFEESFRLHADMAEFLRREIYQQDGIAYFSRRQELLPAVPIDDPFVASVLAPDYSLVVVTHEEAASQVSNSFEQQLITPVLAALADPARYNLGPEHGLGVVVPHRAQRAALQEALPALSLIDKETGTILLSSVDTVERFQGSERSVILVSATESDHDFLLHAGEFLLDPRRLTVAISRAKQKMILVAARSIFNLFSADETVFNNSLLWKNLLRHTCTELLWSGERHGQRVEVWGKRAG